MFLLKTSARSFIVSILVSGISAGQLNRLLRKLGRKKACISSSAGPIGIKVEGHRSNPGFCLTGVTTSSSPCSSASSSSEESSLGRDDEGTNTLDLDAIVAAASSRSILDRDDSLLLRPMAEGPVCALGLVCFLSRSKDIPSTFLPSFSSPFMSSLHRTLDSFFFFFELSPVDSTTYWANSSGASIKCRLWTLPDLPSPKTLSNAEAMNSFGVGWIPYFCCNIHVRVLETWLRESARSRLESEAGLTPFSPRRPKVIGVGGKNLSSMITMGTSGVASSSSGEVTNSTKSAIGVGVFARSSSVCSTSNADPPSTVPSLSGSLGGEGSRRIGIGGVFAGGVCFSMCRGRTSGMTKFIEKSGGVATSEIEEADDEMSVESDVAEDIESNEESDIDDIRKLATTSSMISIGLLSWDLIIFSTTFRSSSLHKETVSLFFQRLPLMLMGRAFGLGPTT
ncbi:hypothetical protein WG66_015800 [Moniliophthora roreri]|nr:hypothetical protein WG66_015800 [Moniliophthora roreri]